MNMTGTQAAGLSRLFIAPDVEHDAKVFTTKPLSLIAEQLGDQPMSDLPDVPCMIVNMQAKVKRLDRLNELSALVDFIGEASLIECKLIICELIDRVSTLVGSASELEDAACALTKDIESDERLEKSCQG